MVSSPHEKRDGVMLSKSWMGVTVYLMAEWGGKNGIDGQDSQDIKG